jgi:hypothetical protein
MSAYLAEGRRFADKDMRQWADSERIPIQSKRDVLRSTLKSVELNLEVVMGIDVLATAHEEEPRVLANPTLRKALPVEAGDLVRFVVLRVVEDPVDPGMLHTIARFEHVAQGCHIDLDQLHL